MSQRTIEHEGVITEIDAEVIKVRIQQRSACSECHMRGGCSVADVVEKIVEIPNQNYSYAPGDAVTLVLKQSQGIKALVLGYLFPFVILVVTLVVTLNITKKEDAAGLVSVVSVFLYYLALYGFRKKIKRQFDFKLKT